MLNGSALNGVALNATSVRSVKQANTSWDAQGVVQPIEVYRTRLSAVEWDGRGVVAPVTSIRVQGAVAGWTAKGLTVISIWINFAAEAECEVIINLIAATQPIKDAEGLCVVTSNFEGTVRPALANTDSGVNVQFEALATKIQPLRETWIAGGYTDDIPVSMHRQALVPIEIKCSFTSSETFFDDDTGITTEYSALYAKASATILLDPVVSLRDAHWYGVITPTFVAYRVYPLNLRWDSEAEGLITATKVLTAESFNWNTAGLFTNNGTSVSVSAQWTGNHNIAINRNKTVLYRGATTDWETVETKDYSAHAIRKDFPVWESIGAVADIECTVMVMSRAEWQAEANVSAFTANRVQPVNFAHHGVLTSFILAGVVGKAPAPPSRCYKVGPHLSDFYVNAIQQEFEEAA